MLKLIKEYVRGKILLLIKSRLLACTNEKHAYSERMDRWNEKQYTPSNCETEESFNERKREQIRWSHDQYIKYFNLIKEIEEIIKVIENEKI